MTLQLTSSELETLVQRIQASGALGRSPVYVRLLKHLAEASKTGAICSEITLATDVFGKGDEFDVTSDSTVRVYVHNLRQKLHAYYEQHGANETLRLQIPKGSYRLAVERRSPPTEKSVDPIRGGTQNKSSRWRYLISASLISTGLISTGLGACLVLLLVYFTSLNEHHRLTGQQQALWGSIVSDSKPIVIVIGDYYIFGEETGGTEMRLVREFDINSPADLRDSIERDRSGALGKRFDMGLTYLPRGSAYALSQIQDVLLSSNKRPRVAMMSEFEAEDLRSSHVIYLGYVSGLGVLEAFTFAASRFEVGFSYDELVDSSNGKRYVSNLIEAQEDRNFVDYGILSSFRGTGGNQIIVIAGTRDAGLMEMSDIAVDPELPTRVSLDLDPQSSFISMFEVYGFNLTNISSVLVGSEYLDTEFIWGG